MSRNTSGAMRVTVSGLLLAAAACGGSTAPAPPPPPPPAATATQLAFTVPPADVRTLAAFAAAPAVEIRDAAGARVATSTASVTVTLAGGTTGATLRGTTTVAAVNGIATFPGLSVDSAGTGYTLVARATGLTSATSPAFAVRRTPAVLAFRTQPVPSEAGLPFTTQPVVEIRDSATGAVLTDRRDTVTLAITTRPSNGTLQGTARVAAVAGVATFSGLSIDVPGPGYVLSASGGGAPAVTSTPFSVLSITTQLNLVSGGGQTGQPSRPLPQPIRVRVVRAVGGTPLAGQTVTFQALGGGSVTPASAVSDQNGEVTTSWTIGASGTQTLVARNTNASQILEVQATFASTQLTLTQLTAGDRHFCGIEPATAGAACWGLATSGQLGNGPTVNPGIARNQPVRVSGDRMAVVYAGGSTSCGTDVLGITKCWGFNGTGQLGNGTLTNAAAPVAIDDRNGYTDIGVGPRHVCGISAAPAVRCWGANTEGQLGDGLGGTPRSPNEPRPVNVSGNPSFRRITSGLDFSCGLDAAGIISCWGTNAQGQLGDGTLSQRNVPTPVQMPAGIRFQSVASKSAHSCAVSTTGRLFCWGSNSLGQLGDGSTTSRSVPTEVNSTLRFRSVTTGGNFTCAIADDGEAYCWGRNQSGELGDGTESSSRRFINTPVSGGRRWLELASAEFTTCGIEAVTLNVFCWGSATNGALGDGGATEGAALRPQPVLIVAP